MSNTSILRYSERGFVYPELLGGSVSTDILGQKIN